MFATALIVFREVLEASTDHRYRHGGVPRRSAQKYDGDRRYCCGSPGRHYYCGGGGKNRRIGFRNGQEILNAVILGPVLLMLGWHNIWMSRHGREIAATDERRRKEVALGSVPVWVLASAIALAVFAGGAESCAVPLWRHGWWRQSRSKC